MFIFAVSSCQKTEQQKDLFVQYEQNLTTTSPLNLVYEVESVGAFKALISGEITQKEGEWVVLGSGLFGKKNVEFSMHSHSDSTNLITQDTSITVKTPEFLQESVIYGLTRMGVLHNLSRLMNAQLPDHSESDPTQWVTTQSIENDRGSSTAGIKIFVNDHYVASAKVFFREGVLPFKREQTVYFGADSMTVTERYQWQ